MAPKVLFIRAVLANFLVIILARVLNILEASIIKVATAYIITALVNILKTFYTFRPIGLPIPEPERITIEELRLVLPENIFCPKFRRVVSTTVSLRALFMKVLGRKVPMKTVPNVGRTVLQPTLTIIRSFVINSIITMGMTPLVIVVTCPRLFRATRVASSTTIVFRTTPHSDMLLNILTEDNVCILKVVDMPVMTPPIRFTSLTLKEVSTAKT